MIQGIFRAARIAGTGLRASRSWMNIISNNIANVNTVDTGKRTAQGNFIPYARQVPVFSKVLSENFRENKVNDDILNGVKVRDVAHLDKDFRKVYDPAHPASRVNGSGDVGYVYYPGINVSQEMADLKVAAASYEANVTVASVSEKMMKQAMSLGRNG